MRIATTRNGAADTPDSPQLDTLALLRVAKSLHPIVFPMGEGNLVPPGAGRKIGCDGDASWDD